MVKDGQLEMAGCGGVGSLVVGVVGSGGNNRNTG